MEKLFCPVKKEKEQRLLCCYEGVSMSKALYIAEKPSVAREFAKALNIQGRNKDGYLEADGAIVTWCVGHLVTMSYPEAYDERLRKWRLETLPFLPKEFKYEVIDGVKKQFNIVKDLLNRKDVDTIYVCTDSGREGEYIYRLVDQMSGVSGKAKKRVWIDSQTEEEILRGIKEAKDLSDYDNLADAAYLRAKEDYLMGINFSRLLTLKYGQVISNHMKTKYTVLSVGRVMTCVLGMVVRREREIRSFVKTPFYRVLAKTKLRDKVLEAEWKAVDGSKYFNSPLLYKENGFKKEADAKNLINYLQEEEPVAGFIETISKKKEKKNPPLLYNLAELQNECSKIFKLSPDETLKIAQELYEKKLITYPRTDARVLSTAVTKEITKNIDGLKNFSPVSAFVEEIMQSGSYKSIGRTRYVNDKQITDHYAIIPTGQGFGTLKGLSSPSFKVYELIARRFLSIFYPPAQYQKISFIFNARGERFFANYKILIDEGYLKVVQNSEKTAAEGKEDNEQSDMAFIEILSQIRKGEKIIIDELFIKEGETTPPKRYNSGSIILAMESAGQLIEDEDLRAQIKGNGIGTSATRAEILKKLITIKYLNLNKKTQIITPTLLGENIFDVVNCSIKSLLNPELTASWEKGLNYVANGSITTKEYMVKLEHFICSKTNGVLSGNNQYLLREKFEENGRNYRKA